MAVLSRLSKAQTSESATVRLVDVTVRYGRLTVLRDVDFAVEPGECVAVSGANGVGKTTLLRALAGVFRPNAGRRVGPRTCAYVPATVEHTPVTAGHWLAGMPRSARADPHVMLEALGFDGDLRAPCRALSFGNSRKLLLAEALSSGEQFVVIDEVSAGLDQRDLMAFTGRSPNCARPDALSCSRINRHDRFEAPTSPISLLIEVYGSMSPVNVHRFTWWDQLLH